jgi:type IV pilus assembly protein PilN
MTKINLLPWRDELRQKRKKGFVVISCGVALLGILLVAGGWFFFDYKLQDQLQANQLIVSTNQDLDQKLKSLEGLQEQRNQVIERMKLIQGLQSQRPVVVRLVDELARVIPENLFITKFSRTGDLFTFEGKADNPNTVAEFLRNLETSPWYRNAFMNSFLAWSDENKSSSVAASSIVPRVEDSFGHFVVTANVAEPAVQEKAKNTVNQ